MTATSITVGTPATILYYTDTRAAVVTKITEKGVWIARVETTNRRRESDRLADGEFPVILEDGVLDQPIGPGERYTRRSRADGTEYATRGDLRAHFGSSVSRIDYRE